jgi:hypothetical protein
MKKSGEDLSRAQDQMEIRRKLLASGKVRLAPKRPQPPPKQKDEETTAEDRATGS